MKPLVLLLLPICFSLRGHSQQSSIQGIVSMHNSETNTGKRQYVVNAQVEDDFRNAQPRVTDNNGQFGLVFVGKAEKTTVSFKVKKAGLEVVDPTKLTAITGQHDLVRISMAHPDSIEEYKRQIFEIGKSEAEKRLEKTVQQKNIVLAQLRKSRVQNTDRIKHLEEELSLIEDQRQKIEEEAQDLARKYAPVNLDDASTLFRITFQLFQSGQLDSALLILNKANLADMVYQILQERQKIVRLKKEILERDSLENLRREDVGAALQFKADLHKTLYEFDSAFTCYKLLIQLDSFNAGYLINYAGFLAWLNHHDEAISYYSKVLLMNANKLKGNPQIDTTSLARISNEIGILYADKKDFTKAEQAYQKALEIYSSLSKVNSKIYEPDIAMVYNNLGVLYSKKEDFENGKDFYQKALEIYKQFAKLNPKIYEPGIASTQNNLGLLYSDKYDFVNAEQAYLTALEIYGRFAKLKPQIYEPDVAITQNNLGTLYSKRKDLIKSEQAYKEALRIYERFDKVNPQTYDPQVASTLNNIGNLYKDKNDFVNAENVYLEAFNIYDRLVKIDLQVYEDDFAGLQCNLALLYSSTKKYNQSVNFFSGSLRIRKKLMKSYPDIYTQEVKETVDNLLDTYLKILDSLKYESFKGNGQFSLVTIEDELNDLWGKNMITEHKLSRFYGLCSWYLLFASKFKDSQKAANKGLQILSSHIWIKTELAHALLFDGKYEEALNIYQELKTLKDAMGKPFATICLEELQTLENEGITHPDVIKIRKLLKE